MNQTWTFDQTILSALFAILAYAVAWFTTFLNSKTTEIKQKNRYTQLNAYIDIASKTVLDTVNAGNQTVVSDLKAASADGKLTKDERSQILGDAVNNVLITLSDDVKAVLGQAFTDIPAWVETQIESFIDQKKVDTSMYGTPISEYVSPIQEQK